jgi:uncharacterized protein (DUF488 family)
VTKIWTIGYENVGQSDLIACLKDAKVDLLVDVRELPNSRRAGFSKNILAAGLAESGIGYRHMKALGTPKAGRDASKRGDIATMKAIVAEKLDTPEAQLALQETAELAHGKRICLMCLEHDWRRCHRADVAERLKAFGCEAVHLAPQPNI